MTGPKYVFSPGEPHPEARVIATLQAKGIKSGSAIPFIVERTQPRKGRVVTVNMLLELGMWDLSSDVRTHLMSLALPDLQDIRGSTSLPTHFDMWALATRL